MREGGEEVCDARATVTREVGGRRRASGPSPGAPRRCASGTKVTCARRDTHSRESDWGSSKGGGYGLRRGRKQDTPGGDIGGGKQGVLGRGRGGLYVAESGRIIESGGNHFCPKPCPSAAP